MKEMPPVEDDITHAIDSTNRLLVYVGGSNDVLERVLTELGVVSAAEVDHEAAADDRVLRPEHGNGFELAAITRLAVGIGLGIQQDGNLEVVGLEEINRPPAPGHEGLLDDRIVGADQRPRAKAADVAEQLLMSEPDDE